MRKEIFVKLAKSAAIACLLLVAVSPGILWYDTFLVGEYYRSAGFYLFMLGALTPTIITAVTVWLAVKIIRYDGTSPFFALLLAASLGASGCDYANANVQTLVTNNCGVSWKIVKPGEALPARVGPCAYKVTVPDYPMQGETAFKTSFKNKVMAKVEVSYEYEIFDGVAFIGEAKYLGKPNTASSDSSNSAANYESAENAVIDKRIRDVASEFLREEDIVDFSQGEFEDKLFEAVNAKLKDRGVRLNYIAFIPIPEEQTRLAIDLITAMKIYQTKGLDALGKDVAAARASATQITVGQCERAAPTASDKE